LPLTLSLFDAIRSCRLEWFHNAASSLDRRRNPLRKFAILAVLAAFFGVSHIASAQTSYSSCGSLENAYGPFDYRKERNGKLHVVEAFHFTPNIESLIRGNSGPLGGELDYTLRASPNHHRALLAMVRLVERLKTPQPTGSHYTIDCWFDRALRFQPDDTTVRMIFATYLSDNNRKAEAIEQLERADATAGENAFTHYNIGLVYFDLKEYERATQQAHKAMALGFEWTTLREMLEKAGHWKPPPTEPAAQVELKKSP
jgi:Tfp pilus assembly protein PilF